MGVPAMVTASFMQLAAAVFIAHPSNRSVITLATPVCCCSSMSSSKAKSSKSKSKRAASPSPGGASRSSGYLLTCDPPMKQFIIHLNDQKIADKKFIIEDLDATHLLIKGEVRDEITKKVEEWMDEVSEGYLCYVLHKMLFVHASV